MSLRSRSNMKHRDFDVAASRATEPFFYSAPTPPGTTPRQYQLAGVEYALAREHVLFGDAPGVGKTAQCILLGNAIGAKKSIVVCPASLRLNWEREIWRWSMIENVSTYPVLKSSDGVSLEANYVIVSYDLLRNPAILAAVMDQRWDHVILDEAHAIKDPKGNGRTKAICGWMDKGEYVEGISDRADRLTLASGTILPNQPSECYNAIRLLDWSAIDNASLEDFREYYYDFGGGMVRGRVFDEATQSWKFKLHYSTKVRNVPRNLDDLQYRLRKHIMVRRVKEQVLKELPPKQWHVFPLAITSEIRRALKHPGWAAAQKLYEMDPEAFDHGIPVDGAISTARLELGVAKAAAVADYIDDLMESGVEKMIVAAHHHQVLDYLKERLQRYGVAYMDGSTSARKKQAEVDRFQSDAEVGIMLGQTQPLGEGWTLTAAQDAVLAEPDWVPGKNDQLVDRLHRMGQKGSYVEAHVPVVPGTLDEKILATAIQKDQHIYAALDKEH